MSDESVIRTEKTEFYVGLFIVVGIAIMGTMIWQFGSVTDSFRPKYGLKVVLPDATGVIDGAQVRLAGVTIGKVKSRNFLESYRGIELNLEIYEEYRIPANSDFTSATSGLMGDSYIKIIPPRKTTGAYIEPGSTVSGEGSDLVADLSERATELSDQMSMVLSELDSAVRETRVVVENLTSVSEKFDQKIMSQQNVGNFNSTIEKLSETTDNLALASGKLAPLIDESKKTVETAAEPFKEATVMIAKLDKAIEELEPAFEELGPTISDLRTTVKNANKAIEDISEGDGLIAALISDEELKNDMKSLIANLEKHGVLGYKKGKERNEATGKKREDEPAEESTSNSEAGANRWGLFRKR
tara:strand:+ start:40338 stop:41408 length:1071 start_codon:yes stop_codon:yes gene_type:complete